MRPLLFSTLALLLTIACTPVMAQGVSTPRVTINVIGGILATGDPYLMISWYDSRLSGVQLEILDLWGKGRLNRRGIPSQDRLHFESEKAGLKVAGCSVGKDFLILTDFCLKRYRPDSHVQSGRYPDRFIQEGKTYEVRVLGKLGTERGFISPLHRVTILAQPGAPVASTPVGPIPPVNYPPTPTPTSRPTPTPTPWPTFTPRPPRPTNEIGLPPGYVPYRTPTPYWMNPTATPWPTPTPSVSYNRRYKVHGIDGHDAGALGRRVEEWLAAQNGYTLHSVVPTARDRVLVIVERR